MHPDLKKYLLHTTPYNSDGRSQESKRGHIMKDRRSRISWCGRHVGFASVICNGACRRCVELYEGAKRGQQGE